MTPKDNELMYALILEHNKGFLPRAIRFFMNLYRKMNKLPKRPIIHNHVEILYWIDGVGLMVVGAVKGGFRPRLFAKQMPESHWKNLAFYVPKYPFTQTQKDAIEDKIHQYIYSSHHYNYEYLNFISWIVYIVTFGKVRLSRKTDKVMECYEAGARIYNAAGPYFKDPEYTDIFTYYNNHLLVEVPYIHWTREIRKILTPIKTERDENNNIMRKFPFQKRI